MDILIGFSKGYPIYYNLQKKVYTTPSVKGSFEKIEDVYAALKDARVK